MKRLFAFVLLVSCLVSSSALAAPVVAAATGWAAALAKAAGARDVVVIAPESLQHPPDYDPKPSDLLRLKDARFILLGGFEGFAQRLRDAAGSNARMIEVRLLNDPETIHAEVLRLADLFGTRPEAEAYLQEFDAEYARLHTRLRDHFAAQGNRAAAQKFMSVWAGFAGLELVGTYGPGPVQPSDMLRLSAENPDLVLDNAHMPSGAPIAEAANAPLYRMINFPPPGMELLDVFRINAQTLLQSTGG